MSKPSGGHQPRCRSNCAMVWHSPGTIPMAQVQSGQSFGSYKQIDRARLVWWACFQEQAVHSSITADVACRPTISCLTVFETLSMPQCFLPGLLPAAGSPLNSSCSSCTQPFKQPIWPKEQLQLPAYCEILWCFSMHIASILVVLSWCCISHLLPQPGLRLVNFSSR